MEFLKNIGKAVGDAANYLGEKNRRAARLNRIRSVIRCQEKAAEREYLALGRYYYHSLRDKDNIVTESHCAALDQIEEALDNALDQLEKFYGKEDQEEITLEDVEAYDENPIPEETLEEAPVQEEEIPQTQSEPQPQPEAQAAPAEENDDLPFEG
ncbi:uncharacterized protein BN452_01116 [Clostridium sp. CAG:1013]|jgi:hypothetical protein|nr:uncharacterized protein BN452_01116 [Clostridium sp. CAG:1013]